MIRHNKAKLKKRFLTFIKFLVFCFWFFFFFFFSFTLQMDSDDDQNNSKKRKLDIDENIKKIKRRKLQYVTKSNHLYIFLKFTLV